MTMTYDEWLQSPYYDNEDPNYDDVIFERTKDYMREGELYDPYKWENFSETIYSAKQKEVDSILDWAKNKEFEKLGRAIWCLVHEIMEESAKEQAVRDYDNGKIGNDKDEREIDNDDF